MNLGHEVQPIQIIYTRLCAQYSALARNVLASWYLHIVHGNIQHIQGGSSFDS